MSIPRGLPLIGGQEKLELGLRICVFPGFAFASSAVFDAVGEVCVPSRTDAQRYVKLLIERCHLAATLPESGIPNCGQLLVEARICAIINSIHGKLDAGRCPGDAIYVKSIAKVLLAKTLLYWVNEGIADDVD